ncbi:MAG TPA: flagellar basal-body MS-ring/collar protein FliF [Azoarcus taiwanensis]|nr:flagellar basal-body MS-ring/collar protein FliF [Azoarcus taiwanensis]
MATADTATAPDAAPGAQVMQRLNALTQRQKMSAAAAIAFALSLIIGAWLWARTPDYAVLFANLDERDGGAIVTALQQQNIAYRFSPGGTAIMIPSGQVHDVRLRLAAQGIPKGGLVGFEVMENQRLGVSQFLEQVNYQRALEGELSRTVQSIASVSAARVHLAIPKQSGFLRDAQRPSASVMVNLYPGRSMDPMQVAGIVHLIASSVPQMSNEAVSVVDQNGNLLTHRSDPMMTAGLDATQLEYVRQVEAAYVRRIETLLAPLVGSGNFRAQVTADVDFNRIEETAETFRPNPAPDQAIRSQQTTEQLTRDPGAQGVPGALTNQPPVPATAPITDPAVPGTPGENGLPLNSNRSATINYELDRTIQHIRQSPGQIRRLSVAVVVNHRTETLPNGQTRTVAPSEEETNRIRDIVREAMGFEVARGDSLNVSTAAFTAVEEDVLAAPPLWKDPDVIQLAKELFRYFVVLLVIGAAYFGVVRPLIKSFEREAEREREREEAERKALEAAALEGDEDAIVQLGAAGKAAPSFQDRLERARQLARDDPRVVANLIKEWMAGEEGKK